MSRRRQLQTGGSSSSTMRSAEQRPGGLDQLHPPQQDQARQVQAEEVYVLSHGYHSY